MTVTAAVAAGSGSYSVRYADQDDALELAEAAVPGLLSPFLAGNRL
jgi:putative membrane protein